MNVSIMRQGVNGKVLAVQGAGMGRKVCGNCGSGNLRDEFDRKGRCIGKYCFMCGSKNIKEIEEVNMAWRKCSIEGCDKHAHIDGLCGRHYREKHGHSYKPKSKKERQKCKIDGCEKYPVKEGYCTGHYKEKTGGSPKKKQAIPKSPKKIPYGKSVIGDAIEKINAITVATAKFIPVDFTGHEELLEKITQESFRDFRSVECQILYLLQRWVDIGRWLQIDQCIIEKR